MNKEAFLKKISDEIEQQSPKYCFIYNIHNFRQKEYETCECGNTKFYNLHGNVICSKCFKRQFTSPYYDGVGNQELTLSNDCMFQMTNTKKE